MSRSTQIIGLNEWASEIKQKADIGIDNKNYTIQLKKFYEGMFSEPYPFYTYVVDGKEYTEFVQDSPWASGPMIFLALQDINHISIQKSLWTAEEIEEYL